MAGMLALSNSSILLQGQPSSSLLGTGTALDDIVGGKDVFLLPVACAYRVFAVDVIWYRPVLTQDDGCSTCAFVVVVHLGQKPAELSSRHEEKLCQTGHFLVVLK